MLTTKSNIDLDKLADEEILELRFCDLPIKIEDSEIAYHLGVFLDELEKKGVSFTPPFYLADEWLCPEGIPAVGIPFYLAHPRLRDLEKKMVLEVEGGTKEQFLKLIRHETGHALSYAYHLQRRPKWRALFGHPAEEFTDYYRFRKYSKWYVHNLENFYAQSHPDEDFAETFAVWLDPQSNWRERYKGWRALEKLDYVDKIMRSLNGERIKGKPSTKDFNIRFSKSKLKTHYRNKKRLYAADHPDFYDADLLKIFTFSSQPKGEEKADAFLRNKRNFIIRTIAGWSGEKKYIMDHVLRKFIERSRELSLICRYDESETLAMLVSCVTVMVKNYQATGMFKEYQ